jgi:hypothetical protein
MLARRLLETHEATPSIGKRTNAINEAGACKACLEFKSPMHFLFHRNDE